MAGTEAEACKPEHRQVFLSHSSVDKPEVEALRMALDSRGIACFLDALELHAGDDIAVALKEHVQEARAFVVVLSPEAVSSNWVRREIEWALAAEDRATETGGSYRFIPVFTRGIAHGFLGWLGRPEVLGIDANDRPLTEIASAIAQALGVLPVDARPRPVAAALAPIAELTLDFHDLSVEVRDEDERVRGRVRVEYQPSSGPRGAAVAVDFESPLGAMELGELRWYLETWPGWSFGNARLKRATEVEEALPKWGRALFDACLVGATAPVEDFERGRGERRIVVQVPAPADVEDTSINQAERTRRLVANAAAARLLALPWELLRGPRGFLFEGSRPVRVVRRVPRERAMDSLAADRRILRVLLLVARTADAGWIDPRVSLTPLVAALAPLGDRVELVVAPDGSFKALGNALLKAERQGRPFHVVHFDGHGVYDPDKGLGLLVFEDEGDCATGKIERKSRLVDARMIGDMLREHRIPLFVLEACQSAQADAQVTSSVAAELVAAGIGSVVAMSHSVLVETARRFVGSFYPALACGERIGTAMVDAQVELARDPDRSPPGLPRWVMQDWFVPVLFQEHGGDVRLLPEAGLPQAADVELVQRTARGKTLAPPAHGFVGRDRELLALSRLLHLHRVVLLRGTSGVGKTALAAECARWLLDVHRVRRLAWASVETHGSAEAVLQDLGSQLMAGFAVSRFDCLERARHALERVLRDRPALLVIDNFESVAADPDPELMPMLAAMGAIGDTRVLVTSREPAPAALGAVEMALGAMGRRESRMLVEYVLRRANQTPKEEHGDLAETSWIDELVDAVGGNPRALVLLAPQVLDRGARVTRQMLAPLMRELEQRHPGDRENSLLASIRLSLNRLEPKRREQVRALAAFHGAAHVFVLAHVLGVEQAEAHALGRDLVDLGVAEANGPYLQPDPALGPALDAELEEHQREHFHTQWLAASLNWISFLYQQLFQDSSLVMAGTRHALGALMAVVEEVEQATERKTLSVEIALGAIGRVEQILELSANRRALALVVAARERLAGQLTEWSSIAASTYGQAINHQARAGDLAGAIASARTLHERTRAAGPEAYEGAAYDMASSSLRLAHLLDEAGHFDESLRVATEAEEEFRALARKGNTAAAGMAVVGLGLRGNALGALGRLHESAAAYAEAIEEADVLGDRRGGAVKRAQFGNVLLRYGHYAQALEVYEQARITFEGLGEPLSVAIAWNQIATVHRYAGQHHASERAYLRSLEIETLMGNLRGQAKTLHALGHLYTDLERIEEAAEHHERAAALFGKSGDLFGEGAARHKLSVALYRLSRTSQARDAAIRAIALKQSVGPEARQWEAWHTLSLIERDIGDAGAAAAAHQQAIATYASFRRDGGSPQFGTGQLVARVIADLANGVSREDLIWKLSPPDKAAPNVVAFYACLHAILAGNRDPALLEDQALDYHGVVELTLLLEKLS